MMINLRKSTLFCCAALVIAGCSSSPQKPLETQLPESAHESSTHVIQYAAGYCNALSEKHDEDFKTCFIKQTDLLMEKVKAQQAKEDEDTPVVLSKNGHDVMYIKRIYSGVESMTQEQIGWSKKFGTYDDVASSNAIEQASVWVGTKTIKTGNKCVETTSSVAEIPNGPGEPKMNVTEKVVSCPNK